MSCCWMALLFIKASLQRRKVYFVLDVLPFSEIVTLHHVLVSVENLWLTLCLFCSLKLECEKLASEKIEIQRHYVMVSMQHLLISCIHKIRKQRKTSISEKIFIFSYFKCRYSTGQNKQRLLTVKRTIIISYFVII